MVGAGVHGLCTAFALRRSGAARVCVLERFAVGHPHGSSHGSSRITRSSYGDPRWVELAARVRRDGWPLLERELATRLVHPTPGLFFGPEDGPFAAFLAATLGGCAPGAVERAGAAAARARFPLLRVGDGDAVLLDHTAAVLDADATLRGLAAWCRAHGVDLRERTRVAALLCGASEPLVAAVTEEGAEVRARSAVVAAGAWLGALVPEMAPRLTVLRQQVGWFDPGAGVAAEATRPGAFPVWARIDAGDAGFVYGLPAFGRPGLKLAVHRTRGAADDPDAPPPPPDGAALQALARAHLAVPDPVLLAAEPCLYTMAPADELSVEAHAEDPRIVLVTACSGHAFKFAPWISERAAALVTATR